MTHQLASALKGLLKHFEGSESLAAQSGLNYNCYASEYEEAKSALKAYEQEQQPQRYRIMSHSFSRDSNGNPTSRFRIFKVINDDMDVQIYYTDRRQQCGYNDNRIQHAMFWLNKETGKSFKVVSSSGSRSEGCINVIVEEQA